MNASCLVKSIVFMKLVNNSSSYSLCIGVSKINGNFESHAWIEINGNVILNSLDIMNNFKRFLFMDRYLFVLDSDNGSAYAQTKLLKQNKNKSS